MILKPALTYGPEKKGEVLSELRLFGRDLYCYGVYVRKHTILNKGNYAITKDIDNTWTILQSIGFDGKMHHRFRITTTDCR